MLVLRPCPPHRAYASTEALGQHPGVLRPATLAGVDDEFAPVARKAAERGWKDARLGAVEHHERPQVDVAGLERAADDGRMGREHHELLRDPRARVLGQRAARAGQLRPVRPRPDEDAVAPGAGPWLEDE